MKPSDLFDVGSRWKHKEQGFQVFIRAAILDEEKGCIVFRLGNAEPASHPAYGPTMDPLTITVWTAEEMIRNFEPLFRHVRPDLMERMETVSDALEKNGY